MNPKILKLAIKKFNRLKKKYKGFINVGVDNWRGYRFIFDTVDVRKCRNNCPKCPLYLLLKSEKEGLFSTSLYLANNEDKKLFGPQKYLNCKTLKQYKNCYISFLVKKTKTKKKIKDELILIKNFRIIFSRENSNLHELEKEFERTIIRKVLKKTKGRKQKIIKEVAKEIGLK